MSDPDVEAMIAAELGGDTLALGTLLVHYGDESMWPAPVEEYQTPFDDAPQSSPGERIIMNGRYLVVPDPIAHYHELVYTATNGTFDTQGGPASKTFTTGNDVNRIDTGNVSFFLPDGVRGHRHGVRDGRDPHPLDRARRPHAHVELHAARRRADRGDAGGARHRARDRQLVHLRRRPAR